MGANNTADTKTLNIQKLIEQAVNAAVVTALTVGIKRGKEAVKNAFSQTEIRLYAYKDLKDNIEQYNQDIEDLEKEKPGRSKSFVFLSSGGTRLSEEEIQQGRIISVQAKILRDEAEINEVERALKRVENDMYYPIIGMKYFQGKDDDEIAAEINCADRTVRRHKNRLVRRIAIKLYGADAVKAISREKVSK